VKVAAASLPLPPVNVTFVYVPATYPDPAAVISTSLTLLYPEPPLTILIAVKTPLVNVGVRIAGAALLSGRDITKDALSSSYPLMASYRLYKT